MSPIIHLRIAGALLLLLAAAHVTFPRRFNWREDLAKVSLLNRQIFYVHCLFIVILLILIGVLSSCFAPLLVEPTPLARVVTCGLILFWGIRLFVQLFVYDSRHWRGQRSNTIIHIAITLFWAYLVFTYGNALIRAMDAG